MEQLPVIEAALLLSIKMHPNNNTVYHARAVSATVLEVDRAIAALKRMNYVIQDNSGRFTLNEHSIKRANTELMHSETKPTVHRVAETSSAILPIVKTEVVTVNVLDKPTPESLLAQLNVQRNKGMTAGDMAKSYGGADGRSLVQILRKMKTDGLVTKFGNLWYAATKEDAVETIEIPYETRRTVTSADELRKLIKLQKGWFTAKESHDEMSKAFIVDWTLFYAVFIDMATEGEFNVRENGELTSYELSIDGDNSHANCRWDFTAEEFNKVIQDYIYLVGQGGTHRWSLSHCVEITKLRSDLILHWFELAAFDISNVESIGSPVAPEFMPFDSLDSLAVQAFIGTEGCRVTAFMKAFNLDPDTTAKVCSLLELVNIARYDVENKYLMLPNSFSEGAQAPRVTCDTETGESTIQMVQIPDDGFVFIEVHVDPTRAVMMRYQFNASAFSGMHITPTDDASVYLLQVPVELKDEPVDIEGMYEYVRHESLNFIESSEQRQAAYTPARLAAQRQGDTIGEDVGYEEKMAEVTKRDGSALHSKTMSPEAKAFVDSILMQVKERIPPAGETGNVGNIGCEGVAVEEEEHSSMLQIDRPLVGMHLFRIVESVLTEMKPMPETVEDENSPYFGCKITPCTGEHIGYATITIEPGHPMWQPPQYTPRDQAYARNADGTLIIDTDADGKMHPRLAGEPRRYTYTNDTNKAVFSDEVEPPTATEEELIREYQQKVVELKAKYGIVDLPEHEAECANIFGADEQKDACYEDKGNPERGYSCGSSSTTASGGCGLPVRTVKAEWISGLAIISDQHKRSSATHKLLSEIKEYLEK